MANPFVKRAPKHCANPDCGQLFRPRWNWNRQVYCGRQCAADCRPRSSRVAAGRKGGRARSGHYWQTLSDRLAPMSKLEYWTEGRRYQKQVNSNRIVAARKQGFNKGFDAAMKALRPRSTAA